MTRGNGKTYTVRKSVIDLSEADVPSIGPNGSIKGMRKLFWGYDCDVAKQGVYHFKINQRHGEGQVFFQLERAGIAS
jgi:hypothetical protein